MYLPGKALQGPEVWLIRSEARIWETLGLPELMHNKGSRHSEAVAQSSCQKAVWQGGEAGAGGRWGRTPKILQDEEPLFRRNLRPHPSGVAYDIGRI